MKYSPLLYTSKVRPLLTYACPVWVLAPQKKKFKLHTLQNKCLKIVFNSP